MNVVICAWKDLAHPAAGGSEVYVHEIARRWATAGHEVTLLTAAAPDAPAREVVDGVRVVRRGGRLGVYGAARRAYHQRHASDTDLLIDVVNTRPFGCVGWSGGAHVVTLAFQVAADVWDYELPGPLALLGRRVLEPRWLAACRASPVLTISESSRRSLLRFGLRDVEVVPIGCSAPVRDRVVKADTPTIAFVGRLVANKRPGDAIEALAHLRRQGIDARLDVIGRGPLAERLRRDAPSTVTFHGQVTDERRQEIMSRAHVLVATSVREGWGLVVDEAAAAGTPTIAYDVPGLRDSVVAAGGELVAPRPRALASALATSLPELRARPPATGWRGGATDWDRVADEVLAAAIASAGARR